jgi:PBP1b-binding outer membrane lipoprotein LpoB
MKQYIALVFLTLFFSSCNHSPKFNLAEEQNSLQQQAVNINKDFRKIRMEVDSLVTSIAKLYEQQNEIIPGIDKKKYQLANNGVFTKPIDDGGSAIFVSGYYPINEDIKKVVYFTEPIDQDFKALVNNYPEIVQVYYNDKSSINRIYPFFDVLSQYEAKMDIPSFNFYYLADTKHNPEKKSLWIEEPYVDPAGRGWMVSAIAPVYFRDSLVGVPGIDVTINLIAKRYLPEKPESMTMIIDNFGAIVAAQEGAINLLSFPPLFDHKYIETIKQDTYRKDSYNLALSKEINVRNIAVEILQNKKNLTETEINGEKITVIAADIPELNWHLLEILK